ncbi:MAG: hypothetical protein HY245_06845 [Rhizobiales bacterium]|nr:hypothetical protein [Hyphomicrobiales bacterium]
MMRASARICNRVEPVSEGTAEAMQDWDQPHWSGKPQPRPDTRPKLRPNLFARLVRACLRQPNVVTVIVATLTVLASAYAALTLTIDPNLAPRIGLDAQTLAAQARLDEKFPGIGKTLVARIANDDPATARATALAVATALAKRPDLFAQAFVPGTGIYYDKYGFLFKSLDDVNARVTQAMRMQPLFRALTAAPSMAGLSALVQQIGNVLAEGRSPSGLASVLAAASATVESELAGHSQRLSWVEIAGLTADSESKLWFVIVTPAPGVERSAASYAVTATASLPGLSWYLPAGLRSGGGSPVRDLVVPAIVALLAVLTVLLIGLGDVRYLLPVAMTAGVALTLSLGAAAAIDPVLDAASWSILAVATGPAFLFASVVVLAHVEARRRGSDTDVAIMLAAQRRGLLVVMLALVWAIFWVTWLPRSLPSLAELAMMALASIVISAGLAFTLVPVLLQAFDRRPAPQPHWLDEAVAAPPGPNARNALQVLVLVLVAASAFCGVFVPALRFGDVAALSRQAAPLDTPAAIDAVHLLTPPGAPALALARSLAALPETGSIRWIEQFLPEDTGRKLALLRQLDGFLPGGPAASDVPDAPALDRTFADLATGLRQISDSPAASPELHGGRTRRRRQPSKLCRRHPPARPGRRRRPDRRTGAQRDHASRGGPGGGLRRRRGGAAAACLSAAHFRLAPGSLAGSRDGGPVCRIGGGQRRPARFRQPGGGHGSTCHGALGYPDIADRDSRGGRESRPQPRHRLPLRSVAAARHDRRHGAARHFVGCANRQLWPARQPVRGHRGPDQPYPGATAIVVAGQLAPLRRVTGNRVRGHRGRAPTEPRRRCAGR